MPVAVSTDQTQTDAQIVTVNADGALTTVITDRLSSRPRVVPLLVTAGTLAHVRATTSSGSGEADAALHPLALNERLVAMTGHAEALAAALFPVSKIVPVQLDPADPLRDGPTAYQTLDAVIVDGPWPGGLHVNDLDALLAGGTAVALRGVDRPDSGLPWEKVADGWVLRPPIAGPAGCDGDEDAYLPVAGWHPDLPANLRRQIVFAGVLFALVAGACLLLRGRWTLGALLVISIFSCTATVLWKISFSTIYEASGSIDVNAVPWMQTDEWHYLTAAQPAIARVPFNGTMWPVFANQSQALQSHMTLRLTEGFWACELRARTPTAFVRRGLQFIGIAETGASAGPESSSENALRDMARQIYAGPRLAVFSESGLPCPSNDPAPHWPTVHVSSARVKR